MRKRAYYAGVDIGGTDIKIAIVDDRGQPVAKLATPTSLEGCEAVCAQVAERIGEMTATGSSGRIALRGIGIGVPGYVSSRTGTVLASPNLGWKNVPLERMMRARTGLPVVIENDANAAALGELWKGAGSDTRDLVMVTLGTGVGCGIVSDGSVVRGADGFAGEFGHTKMKPRDGDICVCGKRGCLETTSSGIAIVKHALSAARLDPSSRLHPTVANGGKLSVKQVFDAAKQGDAAARGVVEEAAYYLGVALADLANLLNPGKIIIGGGVAAAGDYYLRLIQTSFDEFALDIVRQSCTLAAARLGNDAGFTGSAFLAKTRFDHSFTGGLEG